MNDKIYIEMSDPQRLLNHIYDSLEYAHAEISIGIVGNINSDYTSEEVNKIQSDVCHNLEDAMNGIVELIGAYAERNDIDL